MKYALDNNERAFLDKERRISHYTGVCLNDKGREALEALAKI